MSCLRISWSVWPVVLTKHQFQTYGGGCTLRTQLEVVLRAGAASCLESLLRPKSSYFWFFALEGILRSREAVHGFLEQPPVTTGARLVGWLPKTCSFDYLLGFCERNTCGYQGMTQCPFFILWTFCLKFIFHFEKSKRQISKKQSVHLQNMVGPQCAWNGEKKQLSFSAENWKWRFHCLLKYWEAWGSLIIMRSLCRL